MERLVCKVCNRSDFKRNAGFLTHMRVHQRVSRNKRGFNPTGLADRGHLNPTGLADRPHLNPTGLVGELDNEDENDVDDGSGSEDLDYFQFNDDVVVYEEERQMILADADEDNDLFEQDFIGGASTPVMITPSAARNNFKFSMKEEPAAFSRLNNLPTNILETAYLLHQVPLSRRELKLVSEFVEYHVKAALDDPANYKAVPSAAAVEQKLNGACDRGQDGNERVCTFHVPEEFKDVSERTIEFRVSVGCLNAQSLLT